jgi:glycosyltransferase involved in cell wall biosynthesis
MPPLVSICLITYNHEKYIREAIDSVLMQKTEFPFELLIGEDCSTDGTRQIVFEYQSRHPELIKVITDEHNVGAQANVMRVLQASSSKYIAALEGDDYWTDPYKLQKQVSFLENNPDYAICCHQVEELSDNGVKELSVLQRSDSEETYTIADLATGPLMHTPSVVYRKNHTRHLPGWFQRSPVGDYVLYMLEAQHGKIKYFPQPMAVYRKHAGGMWSLKSRTEILVKWLKVLSCLLEHNFAPGIQLLLKEQYRKHVNELLELDMDNNSDLLGLHLKEYVLKDEELSRIWLTERLPRAILLLKNSRGYKFAQMIKQLLRFNR